MAVKKMTMGTIVRLTSFAHKPADAAEPRGYSASPEDTPEGNRKVFICMLLGIEEQLREDWSEESEQERINAALKSLGYYRVEDLVSMGMNVEVPRG